MTRSLLLATLGLLLHAVQAAVAVAFGWESMPVAPAVVLVAYAALAEPPVEAAITATFLGLILDALSGSPIGLNMLSCLLALLVGRLAARWVTAPRGWGALAFGAALSAGYHLFLLILLKTFGAYREGLGILSVLSTALWDGLLSVVLMPATQWLLVAVRLEEREVTATERLSRRAQSARAATTRKGYGAPS